MEDFVVRCVIAFTLFYLVVHVVVDLDLVSQFVLFFN